jgi:hypothetical protein
MSECSLCNVLEGIHEYPVVAVAKSGTMKMEDLLTAMVDCLCLGWALKELAVTEGRTPVLCEKHRAHVDVFVKGDKG